MIYQSKKIFLLGSLPFLRRFLIACFVRFLSGWGFCVTVVGFLRSFPTAKLILVKKRRKNFRAHKIRFIQSF